MVRQALLDRFKRGPGLPGRRLTNHQHEATACDHLLQLGAAVPADKRRNTVSVPGLRRSGAVDSDHDQVGDIPDTRHTTSVISEQLVDGLTRELGIVRQRLHTPLGQHTGHHPHCRDHHRCDCCWQRPRHGRCCRDQQRRNRNEHPSASTTQCPHAAITAAPRGRGQPGLRRISAATSSGCWERTSRSDTARRSLTRRCRCEAVHCVGCALGTAGVFASSAMTCAKP
jgi:hypothetical protein